MSQFTFPITTTGLTTVVVDQPGRYVVELKVPDAEAEVVGKWFIDQRHEHAVEVIIHHQAPHTRAHTVLKGVATDQAFISFKGKIVIDEGCKDTQSFLEERILLLSDTARAEAVPDLEILCEDVKCSHAATISQIPDEQLFYLSSRGLSTSDAQSLIVEGFLS